MGNRKSHQTTWTALFQRSVRIEALESRQFLTVAGGVVVSPSHLRQAAAAAPEAEHSHAAAPVAAAQAQPAAAPQAKSSDYSEDRSVGESERSDTKRSAPAAQSQPASDETEKYAADESETAKTPAAKSSGQSTEGNEYSSSTGSSAGASGGTSEIEAESEMRSAASPAAIQSSSEARDTVLSSGEDVLPASSARQETQLPALFNNTLSANDLTSVVETAGNGSAHALCSDTTFPEATGFSKTLIQAAAATFGDRPISSLPATLATIGSTGVEMVAGAELARVASAATPFFYFPRIDWIGAASDVWESFAQESSIPPLASGGNIRAWVITTAVGALDAILVGYWIWARNRREKTFCASLVLSSRSPVLWE